MIQDQKNEIQVQEEIPVAPSYSFFSFHDLTTKLLFIFLLITNVFFLIVSGFALIDKHYKICTYAQFGFGSYESTCPGWLALYGEAGEVVVLIMFACAMTLYILPIIFYTALVQGAHSKLKVSKNHKEERFAKMIIFLIYLSPVLFIFCFALLQQNINDRYR